MIREKDITRHLLTNELSVWLVRVKRLNQVITIRPRVFTDGILIMSMGLGIVDDIHPVPGPAFTVLGAGEELVHDGHPRPRIIELPGDRIGIRRGQMTVNGNVYEDYGHGRIHARLRPLVLPEGQFFVMGDNRAISSGGVVEAGNVLGKILGLRASIFVWVAQRLNQLRQKLR